MLNGIYMSMCVQFNESKKNGYFYFSITATHISP